MNFIKEKWNNKDYQELINYLIEISEKDYKEFSSKLISTKTLLLGIRLPILKDIAKQISKGNYKEFLNIKKDKYFEEKMIEGFIISFLKEEDFDLYLDKFVKKIDNWSVCDSPATNMKIIKKRQDKYLDLIKNYANSNQEYVVRFAIVCLLAHYKDEKYNKAILKIINSIKTHSYYVDMAIAWLMCEMLINHRDFILNNLNNFKINDFTFNKFVSKSCDSYRVSKDDKDYLKSLKKNKINV